MAIGGAQRNWPRLVAASLAASATFVILAASAADFVLSDFLTADDSIYLARAAFGQPLGDSWRWELELLNFAGVTTRGVVAPKILAVFMVAASAGVIAALLAGLTGRRLAAALAATAIVLYPITSEVGVFAFGTHPFFAAPFAFAGLAVLLSRPQTFGAIRYHIAAASTILFFVASVMSPTASALVVAPPILLAIRGLVFGVRKRDWLVLGGVTIAVAVTAPVVLEYHYTGAVGWIAMSPETIARNLSAGVDIVGRPLTGAGLLPMALFSFGLVSVMTLVIINWARSLRDHPAVPANAVGAEEPRPIDRLRFRMFFGLGFATCVVLTVAPGLVVTAYAPRYLVLATLFAASMAFAAILSSPLFAASRHGSVTLAYASMIALVTASAVSSDRLRHRQFDQSLGTFHMIEEVIDDHEGSWAIGAQIIVVVPDDVTVPTSGFNHWSTWLMRFLAQRTDITALVGRNQWLPLDPFVSLHRDHGDEYWAVRDGRSYRIRMKGIVPTEPIYTYAQLEPGSPLQAAFINLITTSGERSIGPGASVSCTPDRSGGHPRARVDWRVDSLPAIECG